MNKLLQLGLALGIATVFGLAGCAGESGTNEDGDDGEEQEEVGSARLFVVNESDGEIMLTQDGAEVARVPARSAVWATLQTCESERCTDVAVTGMPNVDTMFFSPGMGGRLAVAFDPTLDHNTTNGYADLSGIPQAAAGESAVRFEGWGDFGLRNGETFTLLNEVDAVAESAEVALRDESGHLQDLAIAKPFVVGRSYFASAMYADHSRLLVCDLAEEEIATRCVDDVVAPTE